MANQISHLQLTPRLRLGGGGRTEQRYLDFVIDGQSLGEMLAVGDMIGCLGWGEPKQAGKMAAVLLLEQPSSLKTGRAIIYVCPECGDISCGAITTQVQETDQHFVWHCFGYENDYDPDTPELVEYAAFGPFMFDKADYKQALMILGNGET